MTRAIFRTPDLAQKSMDRDGFLCVPRFMSETELSTVAQWVLEIAEMPEQSGSHWIYYEESQLQPGVRLVQRIERFCEVHAQFDDFIRNGVLAKCASLLLGGPAVLFKEKINFKLSGGGGFEAHQDQQAGWSRYAPRFVTAVLAIDPATVQNGCLEMEAGLHRQGLLGDEWVPLNASRLNLRPFPTAPGDAIFLDSFAPHSSAPNLTRHPRRILYVTYNRSNYGDQRLRYYLDKHEAFPPDIDRDGTKTYQFKV